VGNEACFRKATDDRSKVFFEGKAVRLAQLTANRLQPMQMKRRAPQEGGVLSFRGGGHGRGSKSASFHYRE